MKKLHSFNFWPKIATSDNEGMLFQPLKGFDKPAQLGPYDNDRLLISEWLLVLMIKILEKPIFWAARISLNIRWDNFKENQGVDPFSRSTRVVIHLGEHRTALGRWGLSLCWDPDHDDYDGMAIEYSFFLVFPIECNPIF